MSRTSGAGGVGGGGAAGNSCFTKKNRVDKKRTPVLQNPLEQNGSKGQYLAATKTCARFTNFVSIPMLALILQTEVMVD